MSKIMIRCPESGSEISTGIDCDGGTFDALPFVVSHAHCPKCGKQHCWSKSDACQFTTLSPSTDLGPIGCFHVRSCEPRIGS